jgi:mannose-6-phosphate isomerase-like protein (cupin superfamily)
VSEPGPDLWTDRPWGRFYVIRCGDGYQVKLLTVDPGEELSLQRHSKRREHWFVLAGTGRAALGDIVLEIKPGDDLQIPVNAKHRVGNYGTTPLEIIELQFGEYLGEDDIERFEDRYGRI